jgi:citrate lyase subunit beta/citryl-CoA lyase
MDSGGMAMTTICGEFGNGIRADVQVTITESSKLEINVWSSVESMYGDAIRDQVRRILNAFDNPKLQIELRDSGALPYVIEARIESAICQHLSLPLPPLEPTQRAVQRNRLRRTRLYVPGNTPKFFTHCALLKPDAVILDLEDAVADSSKFAARALVRRALSQANFGSCEVMVRVNEGKSGLEDISAVAMQGVETFLIPKVETVANVEEIDALLTKLSAPCQLIVLIESAIGIERCLDLLSCSKRIVGASLGLEDYVLSIGAKRTESQAESAFAQSRLINAARAANVVPLASVFPRFDDSDQVFEYAKNAQNLGYEGVGCIHPSQIRPVHDAFRPSEEECDVARKVVRAFEGAIEDARGAISVDGRMVDRPVYERAKRIVAFAEASA